MAKLTTKKRKSLSSSTFALPESRKYPIPDKSHAANAKARAKQQYNQGNISKSTLSKIDAKANAMLNSKKESTRSTVASSKTRRKASKRK